MLFDIKLNDRNHKNLKLYYTFLYNFIIFQTVTSLTCAKVDKMKGNIPFIIQNETAQSLFLAM